MSEPPHQVPFDAWNLQLRPDGWDDLGPVLQSDDLEGWDRHSSALALEPAPLDRDAYFNLYATIDSSQYNSIPSGITGYDRSIARNASSDCSFAFNGVAPAIATPNAFNSYSLSASDYQAVPSFNRAISKFNPSASTTESAAPSTFGYNRITTTDLYHDISDRPPMRDVCSSFLPTRSSVAFLNEYTHPVTSISNHGSSPHLLPGYGNFVPALPAAGSATTSVNCHDSLGLRTSHQNTAPPVLSIYSSFHPTTNSTSVATPSLDGYDMFNPIYNNGNLALPIQSIHAGDTIVPEDESFPIVSLMPMVTDLEMDRSMKETPAASKEVKVGCEYICAVCNEDKKTDRGLEIHARAHEHATYRCAHEECNEKFCRPSERREHELKVHVTDHGRIQLTPQYMATCCECGQAFDSNAGLHRHAREEQHAAYACKCTQTFSRIDVLERHLDQYLPGKPKYPCSHCKRHRGDNGFKRKQHLMQHLRGYHNVDLEVKPTIEYTSQYLICPHVDCPEYRRPEFQALSFSEREKQKPFRGQGEYTKHMRAAHDESPFPCDIAHCPRVGGKGYFRLNDFLKHRKDQHPNAPPYPLGERSVLHRCRELGCDRVQKNGFKDIWGLRAHYWKIHGYI